MPLPEQRRGYEKVDLDQASTNSAIVDFRSIFSNSKRESAVPFHRRGLGGKDMCHVGYAIHLEGKMKAVIDRIEG